MKPLIEGNISKGKYLMVIFKLSRWDETEEQDKIVDKVFKSIIDYYKNNPNEDIEVVEEMVEGEKEEEEDDVGQNEKIEGKEKDKEEDGDAGKDCKDDVNNIAEDQVTKRPRR